MGEGELGEPTGLVVEVPGAPRCLWLTSARTLDSCVSNLAP